MNNARNVLVHATNVKGLGASLVLYKILEDLILRMNPSEIVVVMDPGCPRLAMIRNLGVEIKYYKRFLPGPVSRFLEVFLFHLFFPVPKGVRIFVIGDLPLLTFHPQSVLAHNWILSQNPPFSMPIRYRCSRLIFRVTHRFADRIIVQTNVVKRDLMVQWRLRRERVKVCRHPPPIAATPREKPDRSHAHEDQINFIYPASYNPHKNHKLLFDAEPHFPPYISMHITIGGDEFNRLKKKHAFRRISNRPPTGADTPDCLYRDYKALVFPSLAESYGLPLIEAMQLGIPILAADLHYARAVLGDEGIYFDPYSYESLLDAMSKLKAMLCAGWYPDYRHRLSLMDNSWNNIVNAAVGIK